MLFKSQVAVAENGHECNGEGHAVGNQGCEFESRTALGFFFSATKHHYDSLHSSSFEFQQAPLNGTIAKNQQWSANCSNSYSNTTLTCAAACR